MNEDRLFFCDARLIFSPLSKRLNGICHLSTKFFWTPIVLCVEVMCKCYEKKIYKLFISAREHMVQTLPLNFDNSERNNMAKQEKQTQSVI